jgi:hypothetical protein
VGGVFALKVELFRGRVDRLREVPLVALRIGAAVAAVAEREIVRLLDDLRPGGLRMLAVAVDVVDEDVDQRCSPDGRRVPEPPWRLPEIDAAAVRSDFQLGVQAACRADGAVDFAEAERAGDELDRRLAVLVEQVGMDFWVMAPQARLAVRRRLGRKLRACARLQRGSR